MKKIKITLVKSPIDRSERQKQTVKALGLNTQKTIEYCMTIRVAYKRDPDLVSAADNYLQNIMD